VIIATPRDRAIFEMKRGKGSKLQARDKPINCNRVRLRDKGRPRIDNAGQSSIPEWAKNPKRTDVEKN